MKHLTIMTNFKLYTDREGRCWHNRLDDEEDDSNSDLSIGETSMLADSGCSMAQDQDQNHVSTSSERCQCRKCNLNFVSEDDGSQFNEEHLHDFCSRLQEHALKIFQ